MRETPILDLIYPRRCPMCQDIVKPNLQNSRICPDCQEQLPYLQPPYCLKCGKEVAKEEQEYCYDCMKLPKHFKKGYPLLRYQGDCRKGMEAFKYHNRREYAQIYGELLAEHYGAEFQSLVLDAILPVPVHPHKKRMRGYNQAELLAKELSRRIGLPYYPDYLLRVVDTVPQKELNDRQRLRNLKNAFVLKENHVELRKVLLVDDIYTTGATIEACTDILIEQGVEEVYYTSVCIGSGTEV